MESKLYPLLAALFDVPLIRAYQNGKSPVKPFATYALRWESQPAHFCYRYTPQPIAFAPIESTLELQLFGDNALLRLKQAVWRLKLPQTQSRWVAANMAIVEIGKISDMPYLNEAQAYEMRAVVELRLRYTLELTDDLPFFQRVEMHNLDSHQTTLIGVQNGED